MGLRIRRAHHACGLLAALAAGGASVLATGAARGAPEAGAEVVAHDVALSPVTRQRVLRYWTPRRMLDAARTGADPAGRAGTRSPAGPAASSQGTTWPGTGAVARTAGKVFFTLRGRDYLCSATTVRSANRDLVVTARHCVQDARAGWAANWVFVPGYRDGKSPYGAYAARRMFVADPLRDEGEEDLDVAMVALAAMAGRHVTDMVGAQRIAFGRPVGRQVYAVGYPAEGHYDGERLAYCAGRPVADRRDGTAGQGLRCDMTQGSSGGAWLTGLDPRTGEAAITSVSSFKYADDRSTMYGPYFGKAIKRLYERAQEG